MMSSMTKQPAGRARRPQPQQAGQSQVRQTQARRPACLLSKTEKISCLQKSQVKNKKINNNTLY